MSSIAERNHARLVEHYGVELDVGDFDGFDDVLDKVVDEWITAGRSRPPTRLELTRLCADEPTDQGRLWFRSMLARARAALSPDEATPVTEGSAPPERTYACGFCFDVGWVGNEFVRPCHSCRPAAHERWAAGHYEARHTCAECRGH